MRGEDASRDACRHTDVRHTIPLGLPTIGRTELEQHLPFDYPDIRLAKPRMHIDDLAIYMVLVGEYIEWLERRTI